MVNKNVLVPGFHQDGVVQLGCDRISINSDIKTNHPSLPTKVGIQSKSMKPYYVYILASKRNGTLYTGSTVDLLGRVHSHINGVVDGFTKRYRVKSLVYYEYVDDKEGARLREKQIKEWRRKWKLELIEKSNPEWKDLYDELVNG
jgi:putative endonuclease